MIPTSLLRAPTCVLVLLAIAAPVRTLAPATGLRAGAARLTITPAPDAALPMSGYAGRTDGFKGIHDDLHVRAIVLDDGNQQAAIVACEVIGISAALWDRIVARVTRDTAISREHIMLAAVHTHAAPAIGTYDEPAEGDAARRRAEYIQTLEDAVSNAVQQAKGKLQPARMGFGTGKVNVNMNRRAPDGDGGWMLGNNPDGVSDKTVAVIKFETTSGEPIAIFSNYAVHGTVLGQGNLQVSADLPGAASRVVEAHFHDPVVAAWTSGAAGDQDPIYRVGTDFRNLTALGRLLGDEVVRVAEGIRTSASSGARIRGLQKVVTCPGKRTVQSPGVNREYKIEDAEPVPIRLSLLVIDDVAFAGVSGEVLTNIWLRLKRESPFNRTVMVTHCNGSSGYLPDDAAYDQVSYEIVSTRVKRGCAENAIVNGLTEMMATFF
jgi:Neutral/alkaline non-lysosomal ceramidase, N-terminal